MLAAPAFANKLHSALLLEFAKEPLARKNPGRVRLPKGFEDGFLVHFDRIAEGSAIVPLKRVRETPQAELDLGDEFDEAAAPTERCRSRVTLSVDAERSPQ